MTRPRWNTPRKGRCPREKTGPSMDTGRGYTQTLRLYRPDYGQSHFSRATTRSTSTTSSMAPLLCCQSQPLPNPVHCGCAGRYQPGPATTHTDSGEANTAYCISAAIRTNHCSLPLILVPIGDCLTPARSSRNVGSQPSRYNFHQDRWEFPRDVILLPGTASMQRTAVRAPLEVGSEVR